MTTATMTIGTRTMLPTARSRRSLEELVDRLMNALTFVATPTPGPPLAVEDTTIDESPAKPRRSLEELVDRLMNALTFREEPAAAQPTPGVLMMDVNPTCDVTRAIHEARRLRQSGDLDGALQTLATGDFATAEPHQARWAFSEWKQLVKRRYCNAGVLVYSQGMGRAAALVPRDKGAAEVVTVLGMKWRPGKLVSRRSLRGLRPPGRVPLTPASHPLRRLR